MTKAKVSEAVLLFMEKGLLRITGMETSAKGLLPHELQSGAKAYRKEAFGMDTLADRLNHITKSGHFRKQISAACWESPKIMYISSLGTAAPTADCPLLLQS